jgi:hypothetical protein
MILRMMMFAGAIAGLPTIPALSQDEGMPVFQGLAVAQAPEAGLGVCFGPDKSAIECAEQKCMDESGLGIEDCAANLWCFPAHWAADVFVQHQEGLHWHDFECGWLSREKLEAAVALLCEEDYIIECQAVRIWDPEGNEVLGLVE